MLSGGSWSSSSGYTSTTPPSPEPIHESTAIRHEDDGFYSVASTAAGCRISKTDGLNCPDGGDEKELEQLEELDEEKRIEMEIFNTCRRVSDCGVAGQHRFFSNASLHSEAESDEEDDDIIRWSDLESDVDDFEALTRSPDEVRPCLRTTKTKRQILFTWVFIYY